MSTERRFLIAPSLARLIQREQGTMDRVVEAYFPPRPDRRQLVRVEQQQSRLILLTQAEDGRFAEEQTEIPLSHAEALIDVAGGTIAFDRTSLSLGGDIEALLDRFIIPQGLNLLTVTIPSNPHAFAPLLWFGLEVTDEPAFAAMELALDGAPRVDVMEPNDAALEALLDTLDGHNHRHVRPTAQEAEGRNTQSTANPPSIPVAAGLEAFISATSVERPPLLRQRAATVAVDVTTEANDESVSIRRMAQFLAPRSRSPR